MKILDLKIIGIRSMETVLITGGGGFIGAHLVALLLEEGYSVTVLDTFCHKVNSLGHLCHNPQLTIVRGDVRDQELVATLCQNADWIIPLAAMVGAPVCAQDPISARAINLDSIRSMLGELSPEQRILFPVTNSGYGIGDAGKYCDEQSPLRPISLYGKLKIEAESILMDRGNIVSLRLATVFGMGSRMRIDLLVNDFVYRAVRDKALIIFQGHFKRNFIHVRDVANGFYFAMKNFDLMSNETYNMGLTSANLSKLELAERIQRQIPEFVYIEAEIGEDPDKRDYIVSNEKLEATGWKPEYNIDQGISELVRGYNSIRNENYSNVI